MATETGTKLQFLKDGTIQEWSKGTKTLLDDGLANGSISGLKTASGAEDAVAPAIPVVWMVDIADASGDENITLPADGTWRVIDFYVQQHAAGNAGNKYQLECPTNTAITGEILGTTVANDILTMQAGPAGLTIDDAHWDMLGGSVMTVKVTKAGGNASGVAFITALRVA